jgi:hypothetical protein
MDAAPLEAAPAPPYSPPPTSLLPTELAPTTPTNPSPSPPARSPPPTVPSQRSTSPPQQTPLSPDPPWRARLGHAHPTLNLVISTPHSQMAALASASQSGSVPRAQGAAAMAPVAAAAGARPFSPLLYRAGTGAIHHGVPGSPRLSRSIGSPVALQGRPASPAASPARLRSTLALTVPHPSSRHRRPLRRSFGSGTAVGLQGPQLRRQTLTVPALEHALNKMELSPYNHSAPPAATLHAEQPNKEPLTIPSALSAARPSPPPPPPPHVDGYRSHHGDSHEHDDHHWADESDTDSPVGSSASWGEEAAPTVAIHPPVDLPSHAAARSDDGNDTEAGFCDDGGRNGTGTSPASSRGAAPLRSPNVPRERQRAAAVPGPPHVHMTPPNIPGLSLPIPPQVTPLQGTAAQPTEKEDEEEDALQQHLGLLHRLRGPL